MEADSAGGVQKGQGDGNWGAARTAPVLGALGWAGDCTLCFGTPQKHGNQIVG